MLRIINSVKDWQNNRMTDVFLGKSVGFVPTMGALHEGHLALIKRSKSENDITVVSIFVNPTQFNDPDDLRKYPNTYEIDLEKLESEKVDYLFYPEYNELYPDNYGYKVIESEFSKKLCGADRPGHFDGVLTVVMKLLNIINPDKAYFGEKDYQQYLLIKGMVETFFISTEIIPCQTVRDVDGLAQSSRNKLLTKEERKRASIFPRLLRLNAGEKEIKEELEKKGFKVDYIEKINNRRFGAVRIGKVRLIDNVEI